MATTGEIDPELAVAVKVEWTPWGGVPNKGAEQ